MSFPGHIRRNIHLPLFYLKAALLGEFPIHSISHLYTPKEPNHSLKIPNVVYQTWDRNRLGRTHLRELHRFRNLNPEYSFVFFDTEAMNAYMRTWYQGHPIYDIFNNIQFGASKADVFRYCLLFREGGWYFDINKMINIPLKELVNVHHEAVLSYENNPVLENETVPPEIVNDLQYPNNTFVQWGFGFIKGHPILKDIIDQIVKDYPGYKNKRFESVQMAILDFTATYQWTRTIWKTLKREPALRATTHQCGKDFFGQGVFFIKRSWSRYLLKKSYTHYRNQVIVH